MCSVLAEIKKIISRYPSCMYLQLGVIWELAKAGLTSALTLTTLWADSADDKLRICFLFFLENWIWNCHIQFSRKNKKKIQNAVCWKFYPACKVLKMYRSNLKSSSTANSFLLRVVPLVFSGCTWVCVCKIYPKYLDRLYIALVKALFFNPKVLIFFLFLHENICCGYSLETPRWGASNEYPQHTFSWRNKKNIYQIPSLI